jgi:ABC-2 type transport system permease protein
METSTSTIQTTAPEMGAIHSLSSVVSPWKVTQATTVKGLQIATRYLPNLVGSLVEMSVRVAFFLLMSNAIAMGSSAAFGVDMSGKNLFIFFMGSLVLFVFTRSTLWGPINAVTNDLYNGTLEYLYSNPSSRYAYYVGTVLSEVVISQIVFIPLFCVLAFASGASWDNLVMMLLACIIVLVALTAMGIMIGLLALVWRQVGSVASVLGILFEMLAGAYLPVSSFPPLLRALSYLLPYTWGYDLVRYYSFEGEWKTILPVQWEWGIICLFAVTFTIVSRYLLGKAEGLAKRSGLNVI